MRSFNEVAKWCLFKIAEAHQLPERSTYSIHSPTTQQKKRKHDGDARLSWWSHRVKLFRTKNFKSVLVTLFCVIVALRIHTAEIPCRTVAAESFHIKKPNIFVILAPQPQRRGEVNVRGIYTAREAATLTIRMQQLTTRLSQALKGDNKC